MTSPTAAEQLHRDALVVDGTSFFCEGWNDRLEIAGVTALQMTVPRVVEGARAAIGRIEEYYELLRRELDAEDDTDSRPRRTARPWLRWETRLAGGVLGRGARRGAHWAYCSKATSTHTHTHTAEIFVSGGLAASAKAASAC